MANVTVESFNPFNLLDPFNPFAIFIVFTLLVVLGVALPRFTKNKNAKNFSIVLIILIGCYYLVPNFYAMTIWFLVNKLHWIQ